jgi:flavin-binding protein dodecin
MAPKEVASVHTSDTSAAIAEALQRATMREMYMFGVLKVYREIVIVAEKCPC